jgi:DNA-binding winged helix-turn-helix (wHTH) protein
VNDGQVPLSSTLRATAQPLAARADFRAGDLLIRPSMLSIEGPGGSAKGEPRVIRVLVALADAQGGVLSRDMLLEQCWDGLIVGDDAINRAVAELRRLIASVGGQVEVQTVPRVGYRLEAGDVLAQSTEEERPTAGASRSSRRAMLIGGAALLAVGAGGTALYLDRSQRGTVDELIERGRVLQATGGPDTKQRAAALFRQAIEADPGRADAWGWLAAVTIGSGKAIAHAQRALALDPSEPNARAVMAVERLDLDDWITYEDTLLGIVRDAPECALALAQIVLFYQGMGRCVDSLRYNERAIAVEPFNPAHQARRSMKHWIFGDLAKCDQVANRAMQLWPREPIVWNARMITLAFTDRPYAAGVLLDDKAKRPGNLSPPTIGAWRATLQAIADRRAGPSRNDVAVMVDTAMQSPGMAANAIMALSYIGLLDEAYQVADGLLTQSGQVVQRTSGSLARDIYAGPVWGRTQFVFVPACANLRNDRRFTALCARTGHLAYWQKRGIGPDKFVRGSIKL